MASDSAAAYRQRPEEIAGRGRVMGHRQGRVLVLVLPVPPADRKIRITCCELR
jgi:hypothetical protein